MGFLTYLRTTKNPSPQLRAPFPDPAPKCRKIAARPLFQCGYPGALHEYELSSAAVQIGIVLASASIITAMTALAWLAGGLGAVGIAFCVIGFWFPTAVHLF